MELTLLLPLFVALNQSPAANPPEPPPGVYRVGEGVSSPQLKKQVRPQYTSDAKKAKIQGLVVVSGVVGTDGRIRNVQVVTSLDQKHGLDKEAVKAVKQWEFIPGTRLGAPVKVLVTVELTFTLK